VLVIAVAASVTASGIAGARTVKGCAIKARTSCPGKNLSGQDLRGANLSHANLRGANLNRADLRGANL